MQCSTRAMQGVIMNQGLRQTIISVLSSTHNQFLSLIAAVPIRVQHCGGIIPHFYRFFGILKFWGGDIQVLPIFQVLTILKIWGYIQVLTKMYLNN